MACTQTENFYFAIRKDTGEPVHISYFSQLPDEEKGKYRGLKCNCICAACKRSLVAKMGEVKAPHFAHYVEKGTILDCSAQKANESGLHQMAKEIVKESTYINLPAIEIEAEYDLSRNVNDEKQCEPLHIKDKQTWHFSSAEVEKTCKGFTPDVYLYGEKTDLLVEIMVTHPVGDEKKERVKQVGLPMIEIDISDIYNNLEGFSKETLQRELIDSVEHKDWIYSRLKGEKSVAQLKARNQKLESKYQQQRAEILEQLRRKQQKEEWIEKQQQHEQLTWIQIDRLEEDKDYYLSISQGLVNPERALKVVNNLGICNWLSLQFSDVEKMPIYLNIPVFGEVAFNCDRRIWQTILFEKFICCKNKEETIYPIAIFSHFAYNRNGLLNKELVHIGKMKGGRTYFPKKNLLRYAIEEYMAHLLELGFIGKKFSREKFHVLYYVQCKALKPTNTKYERFLRKTIPQMPLTNQPFEYLQEHWGHEIETIVDF